MSVDQTFQINVHDVIDMFSERAQAPSGPAPTDLTQIRDFDGNDLGAAAEWKLIGQVDVQFDGDVCFAP